MARIRCSSVPVVRVRPMKCVFTRSLSSFLILALWVFAAAPVLAQQASATLMTPKFSPATGKAFVYSLSSTGEVGLDYGEWARAFAQSGSPVPDSKLGLTEHLYRVDAELHLRHLGIENGLWRVAGRLQNVVYTVNGQREFFSKLFEAPFILSYRENGELASMQLSASLPHEISGVIRSLVEPLQIVLPTNHAASWQGRQTDSQSRSVVSYNVTKADAATQMLHIERRLVEQQRNDGTFFNTSGNGPIADETAVLGSGGEILWSLRDNVLVGMTIEDRTASRHNGSLFAEQNSRFVAKLTPTQSVTVLPKTLEEGRTFIHNHDTLRLAQYWVPVTIKQKVSQLTLSVVLERIEKNETVDGLKPGAAMMFFLRLHPEAARELTLHYGRASFSNENIERVGRAYASLAAAGHFEAQQALSEVIADPSFAPMARDRALRSLLSVQMPYSFLLPVVWKYREDMPRKGRNWKVNLSVITNVYGAMGGIEGLDPETSAEVTRVLGQRLQRASTRDEKLMCLTALGNVGDLAKVLPLTAAYFSDEDPDLRRRAFHTYQKAVGDEAFSDFAVRYEAEKDIDVKRTASSIADLMPPSQARNQWAAKQVFATGDTLIRDRLVQILGNGLRRFPENENTLSELLNVETDREIRRTIYRYVGPNPVAE